jgi:hypothetical protein
MHRRMTVTNRDTPDFVDIVAAMVQGLITAGLKVSDVEDRKDSTEKRV